MGELVSKRYALALFDAALDLDKIKVFNEELDFLENIFQEDKELIEILKHPRIKKDEKKDLVNKIFKENVSMEVMNFLYILIDKRRENYILDMIRDYRQLFNEHENIVKVVAMTAVPMEESSKVNLVEVLGKKLNKTIQITNEVDSSIIGGVLLKIENKIVDGSLKGQLQSIARAIGVQITS